MAKFQVFVSSTFEDLKEERRAVIEQVLNMGHIPVGMELFQAANETQWEYIKKRIASSDYFFIIIAERYGSVDGDGKSFTRKEYEYALECKIPVAAFLLADEARRTWPRDRVEEPRQAQIESFRKLAREKLCKFWTSAGDLVPKVGHALSELERSHPQPGWIRADSILFKPLNPDDPESGRASLTLRASVERDLDIAGYYRKNQLLEFEVKAVKSGYHISLVFSCDIVPVRGHARVFKPRIEPPDGVDLLEDTYYVGGIVVDDFIDIDGRSNDRLCVKYEATDVARQFWQDTHHWSCPVLNYTVKFKKSSEFGFGVGRLVGQKHPAPIAPREDVSGEWLLYRGEPGELTAQGLKWKISKAN